MSLHEVDLPLLSWRNIIVALPHWVFFSIVLDMSCIKCDVMYYMISFFIGMVSKVVIENAYEGGNFSCKVMTTSSFLIDISKQAN